MKAKVTKSELRECVANAYFRILEESKNGKKWEEKTESDFYKDGCKHQKNKQKSQRREKGGANANPYWLNQED